MPIFFYLPYKILLIVFSKIKGCFEFNYTTQPEDKDSLLFPFLYIYTDYFVTLLC